MNPGDKVRVVPAGEHRAFLEELADLEGEIVKESSRPGYWIVRFALPVPFGTPKYISLTIPKENLRNA